jgi:hypothetical protein
VPAFSFISPASAAAQSTRASLRSYCIKQAIFGAIGILLAKNISAEKAALHAAKFCRTALISAFTPTLDTFVVAAATALRPTKVP